jgi:hypothetical protein
VTQYGAFQHAERTVRQNAVSMPAALPFAAVERAVPSGALRHAVPRCAALTHEVPHEARHAALPAGQQVRSHV